MKQKTSHKMKIWTSAFYAMLDFIGGKPAESGGYFFGSEDDNIIQRFIADKNAKTSRTTFTMDTEFINPVITKLWDTEELSLLGIAHSHPHGAKNLSQPDVNYFTSTLKVLERPIFYTPILFTIPDGGLEVFPYYFSDGTDIHLAEIEIVPDGYTETAPLENEESSLEEKADELLSEAVEADKSQDEPKREEEAQTIEKSSLLPVPTSLAVSTVLVKEPFPFQLHAIVQETSVLMGLMPKIAWNALKTISIVALTILVVWQLPLVIAIINNLLKSI